MKTYNSIIPMASLIVLVTTFSSCSLDEDRSNTQQREERKEIVLTGETRSTAKNLEDFYLRFTTDMTEYFLTSDTQANKNIVVSPLSAAMVLGMMANGVNESSQEEIIEYLGIDNLSSLNELCYTLLTKLPQADKLADIYLANSLWQNEAFNLSLTPTFSSIISGKYAGQSFEYDFSSDNVITKDAINAWCEKNTDGIIKKYIDEVSPELIFILLNSTVFQAPWDGDIFSENNTKPGIFNGIKGVSETMMMQGSLEMTYVAHNDVFEKFSIPFGNSAFHLEIILPNRDLSVADAQSKLTYENLEALDLLEERCELTLHFPRFKTECRSDITKMLNSLYPEMLTNIRFQMFDQEPTGIVQFKQATSMTIDESGVKAAAVSSADGSLSAPFWKPYTITIDRPFFFFIKEYSTGACILSGLIADI